MPKIPLEPNCPQTNALLGAALSGGDVRSLARAMLPDDHPDKHPSAWERILEDQPRLHVPVGMREFVEHRLKCMAAAPRMWAVTKDGYAMQVFVLLEVLGVAPRTGITALQQLAPTAMQLSEPLDDEFAAKVIGIARELVAKRPGD